MLILLAMSNKTYQFEVLRTGEFTDANGQKVTITDDNLNQLASSYDPENAPAPLVLGHPKDNGPAHGWIDSLKVVGNKLVAFSERVHDDLVNAVKKGLYKKISLSIFNPDSPSNPVPGGMYVRHAGFLGAAAPAVTGLATLNFSEDDTDVLEIEFSTPEKSLTDRIKTILNDLLPDLKKTNQFSKPKEEIKMSDEDKDRIAKLEADLAAEKQRSKKLAINLSTKTAEQRKAEIVSFCDKAIADGKLAPAMKAKWLDLMTSLPDNEIELSEGKTTLLDMAKDLIQHQSNILNFSEKSKVDEEAFEPINFTVPSGVKIGNLNIKLHQKVVAYQKKHDCSYDQALKAVGE